MILSVIIPTRNRSKMLFGTMESIAKQTLHSKLFEVIVVDNGSTDSTRDVVDSFIEKLQNLYYYYEKTPGLHVGRHRGLKEAKADILVYADDDIIAFPTWLEGVAEAFEDPDVGLVGGKILPHYDIDPPKWMTALWKPEAQFEGKSLSWYSLLDLGDEIKQVSPLYVWGCNFSIRKTILDKIGGFHPDGMPQQLLHYRGDGETAVSRAAEKLGCKALYHPKASVYHHIPSDRMSHEYLYQRAYKQGISDSYTHIRHQGGISGFTPPLTFAGRIIRTSWLLLKRRLNLIDSNSFTIHKGHLDGRYFHQHSVWKDKNLLRWVLKTDYRDTAGPFLSHL